jgi:F0F1-type ATP synthase assembly protein I
LVAEKPGSNSPRPPGPGRFVNQLASALDLPFVLVGAVVIGAGGGYLLDRRLGTSPALTLILGALGFAAGIYEVLRRLTGKRNTDGQ